jgi:HSP20 family molecular chaperone IbpA
MTQKVATKKEGVSEVASRDRSWLNESYEGQLSVDVFQQGNDVVIVSTIAGVRVEGLDIAIHNDMVTIRGVRQQPVDIPPEEYFYQECY